MTTTEYYNTLSFKQLRQKVRNLQNCGNRGDKVQIKIAEIEQYIDDKCNHVMAIH